jgi:uncharacterized membrane protein YfcA
MIGALILGLLGGVTAGLLGVGGGIIFVPALVIFLDQTQLEAEATSLLAIIPVATVGAYRQYKYGNVRIADAAVLAVIAPAAAVLGVVVANAVSDRVLSIAFGILLLIVAARLAHSSMKRHDDTPPPPGDEPGEPAVAGQRA